MADALLGITAGNLQAFVQSELATFWGVHSQINELSGNLTAIRAVLQDAEERQITSHAIKNWLQNLSDAAHVLDDILEECSIKANRLQSEECLDCFCPKTILLRYDIGKRMKEMVDRFRRIDEERRRFQLSGKVGEIQQQEDNEWRQTGSTITEDHIYGRDQDKEKIIEFFTTQAIGDNDGELFVYPILGMGGLGKTTLARWVFNDERVVKHFDLRIWVCVSNDFNITRVLQSIIEATTVENPHLSTLESMQKKVQQVLLGKRYLLVLDDVWNEEQEKWMQLKCILQSGSDKKGALVLVTSRLNSAASIMGTCPVHQLLPLSEGDNWSLFKNHAFGPGNEERAELVAIGKQIAMKCAGSPLASKALGSLLRNKKERKQWLDVKKSKFWDIPAANTVMRALRISYFNMNLSLRQCFSFCAIYPEDFDISKEQLIHLWMANGLIKSKENLEVEDVGNEMFAELCQRSFFQDVKTDESGNITFKMHDLFHELAQSIKEEECRVFKNSSFANLSSRLHHMSCLGFFEELNMDAFRKVESLRTYIDLNIYPCNFHLMPAFSTLRALRICGSQFSGLKSLIHLRYLNIYKSDMTTLPDCISGLQKLQVLKLEDCGFLSCLPEYLTQLKDLRHILIHKCWSLVAMPPNIGELKCLKTLNVFIVGSKAGTSLAELSDLKLGGKLHIKSLENARSEHDVRDASLIGKKELDFLYLSWNCDSDSDCTNAERLLEAFEPQSYSTLKGFGINGYGGMQFPSWMRNTSILWSLVTIALYDCKNCEQLPPLGKLPHLTSLHVAGMKDVKYIDNDTYDGTEKKAFKSLKRLTILNLPKLERILRDEGVVEMLPLVRELKVSCSPSIKLPLLPSVEHLELKGLKSISDEDGNNEGMASLPESIVQNMHNLKTLSISSITKLKVLPNELGSLSSLQELDIYNCNELESLQENVLQGLSSLRSLVIERCCKLESLSEGVRHLTCLESLRIIDCPKLVTLPSNMNQLTALRDLAIHGLENDYVLPEGLQRIPSLKLLVLFNVNSLPMWFGDMTSLQGLFVASCPELRSLPSSLQHMTNLNSLRIQSCPKLEKRIKKLKGEEWQKIAHIPRLELVSLQEQRHKTLRDKITFKWNKRSGYNAHPPYVGQIMSFDKLVG